VQQQYDQALQYTTPCADNHGNIGGFRGGGCGGR
jgi:hypothetical protein